MFGIEKEKNSFGEEEMVIKPMKLTTSVLSLIACGVVGLSTISTVPANHVGVVFNKLEGGVKENYIKAGWRFHAPFVESVYKVSTRTHSLFLKPYKDGDKEVNKSITTQTRDGQWLTTQADVQYRVLPEDAVFVFNQFYQAGVDIDYKIKEQMEPVIQRAVESVTSQFDVVGALGAERSQMQQKLEEAVASELKQYGITMQSFTLVDTDAGDEIEKAIAQEAVEQQAIQTAKQQQEKAKIENQTQLDKANADAEKRKVEANAEAEANKKIAESITPELVKYKEAEARMAHGWLEVQGVGQAIVDTQE